MKSIIEKFFDLKGIYPITTLVTINAAKVAAKIGATERQIRDINTGLGVVIEKNSGKTIVSTPIAQLGAKRDRLVKLVIKYLPTPPEPPKFVAPRTTSKPKNTGLAIVIGQLPADRKMIEIDRIAYRLLRQDAMRKVQQWSAAHQSNEEGGQLRRFEKATTRISEEMPKDAGVDVVTRMAESAFTNIQKAIERERRGDAAEANLASYLEQIGFKIGETTDFNKMTLAEADAENATRYIQMRGTDTASALSVITDLDWPAVNGDQPETETPDSPSDEDFENGGGDETPADEDFEG